MLSEFWILANPNYSSMDQVSKSLNINNLAFLGLKYFGFQLLMHGSRKIKNLTFLAHSWARKLLRYGRPYATSLPTPLLPYSPTA